MAENKIKIAVLGASGQLGSEFGEISGAFPNFSFVFLSSADLDITDFPTVKTYFETNDFDVVINCAAYTNVEKAEEESELANLINGEAVGNLARISKSRDILLVHFSTDYVFDGSASSPYCEDDLTQPLNAYGSSKLLGEKELVKVGGKYLIFRVSWLYSSFGNNFVKTMLRLGKSKDEIAVVNDQIGSPTYAGDLAFDVLVVLEKILIEKKSFEYGVYHYCNEGRVSWKGFAEEIFKQKKIPCRIREILTKDYPTKAQRPLWSVLNTIKINSRMEIFPSDWQDALSDCLEKIDDE